MVKKKRSKKAAAAEAGDAKPAQASGRPPPQGRGVTPRPYLVGAPPGREKPNIAMQVLRDPVARTSSSRVYSGQARDWRR